MQDPQDRIEKVTPAIEALGGRIESAYYAFGDHDIVLICEMPDNATAAALALAIGAGGTVASYKTTVLLTPEEAIAGDEPGNRVDRPARGGLNARTGRADQPARASRSVAGRETSRARASARPMDSAPSRQAIAPADLETAVVLRAKRHPLFGRIRQAPRMERSSGWKFAFLRNVAHFENLRGGR